MKTLGVLILSLGFGTIAFAKGKIEIEARIEGSKLYSSRLRQVIDIEKVDKVEVYVNRINESEAKSAEELEMIRALNAYEVWFNSSRYAVVGNARIPITREQEYQIMTAGIRVDSGFENIDDISTSAPAGEERERLEALRSLQLESLKQSEDEIKTNILKKMEALEKHYKNFPSERKITTIEKSGMPDSLTPWRLIVDNMNVYLQPPATGPFITYGLEHRVLDMPARDRLICNLQTQPINNPNVNKIKIRGTGETYYSEVGSIHFQMSEKTLVTATPSSLAYCYADNTAPGNDQIFKSSFESSESSSGASATPGVQ